MNLSEITDFSKSSFDILEKKYAFSSKTGYSPEDLGIIEESQKLFVHEGDVFLQGDYNIGGESGGVYVIRGDLSIEGTFRYCLGDFYQILYVTGNVRAKNLIVDTDAIMFVGGSLQTDEILYTNLTDAGVLYVGGNTTANVIFINDYHSPDFHNKPKAKIILSKYLKRGTVDVMPGAELASNFIEKKFLEMNSYEFYQLICDGKLKIKKK